MNFKIIISLSLIITLSLLSGCMGSKSSNRSDFTEHALDISLSKDGQQVLISHSKGFVDLHRLDFKKNKKLASWAHQDTDAAGIIASDFSLDKEFIVTTEQKTIARYSQTANKVVNFWSLNDIKDVVMSPKGDFALVASAEKKPPTANIAEGYLNYRIVYFHLPYGGIKYAFYHDDVITTIALSDDGRYAISGSDDYKARLWDLESGELKYTWKHKSKVVRVQLSPDGRYAMTNNAGGDIKIYKTKNGKLYRKLKLPRASVSAAAFSPKAKYLATGLSREELIVWHLKSGKIMNKWRPARRYFWQSSLARITSLAFPSKRTVISITSRGIAQKWKVGK